MSHPSMALPVAFERSRVLAPAVAASVAAHLLVLLAFPRPIPFLPTGTPARPLEVEVMRVPPPIPLPPPRVAPTPTPPKPRAVPVESERPAKAPPSKRPTLPPSSSDAVPEPVPAPQPPAPLVLQAPPAPLVLQVPPAPPVPESSQSPQRAETAPAVSAPAPAARAADAVAKRAPQPEPAATPARFNAAYLRNPPPVYPLSARRAGFEGKVVLDVRVTAEGRAAKVDVQETSGFPVLDEAAAQAVERWRFVPAMRDQTPLESTVLVPIVFKLEGPR